MTEYDLKVKEYINSQGIAAQHFILKESCHSVEDAAKAMNASQSEFVKNICMIDEKDRLIIVIVKGEDRASTSRVSKALNIARPRLADEKEILVHTGFPAGGVPSFGFSALFLVDPKVTEREYIYTGGGTPHSLVRIGIEDLLRVNKGMVVRVRK